MLAINLFSVSTVNLCNLWFKNHLVMTIRKLFEDLVMFQKRRFCFYILEREG